MFFYKYPEFSDAKINPSLLWEYNLADFDFHQMRDVVVQRVVERGWKTDWYAALNLYGEDGMKDAIRALPYLNDKDMNFVHLVFDIPLSEMKCYERKQLRQGHWNS